ncbi:hypothetical protein CRUP_001320 [Coryphaenoides rupestris]|nr:hypothetical protein CRUP_001320 [Coryphaenoides rupestris]
MILAQIPALPGNSRKEQHEPPVQRSSALLCPAVMFGTRKTWDLGNTPCLQELWKKDLSLDASSVDFLMSDGEDEGSFLSLPTSAFSQRHTLTSDFSEANLPSQQLLIQTLQEKVCEIQARLHNEEVSHQLQLRRLQQSHEQSALENTSILLALQGELFSTQPSAPGLTEAQEEKQQHKATETPSCPEREQLIAQLRTQVVELEVKLLDQTQEVERLRSELGATDLEKHLELLVVENERLKQELKACKTLPPPTQDPPAASACTDCSHSQDAEALRSEVSRWESQARQRERRLADVEQELLETAAQREALQARLEDLARQAATPVPVKYVTQTVEVENSETNKALAEARAKNGSLQEQLLVQRQLLRELETQLHDSQRTCTQLRTQILVYEGEMERAQGQLEAEMQSLEDEKNRVIEEAFVRAESEMKAVHENLAGVRMNLLTLQPALRTLTCDYNCLKRQVQEFPYMLEKAIVEAKQEICQVISEVSSANQELLRKYKREMNLRKKCHNELVRLKGNIRVFCRVRPVSHEEQVSTESRNMVSFDSDDDAVLYLSNKGKTMTFELDKVFPPQATQEEVFQEVQALVTSCIDGFNVMEKKPDWDYRLTVSMVEIYNETLRNLLGDNPSEKLDIKMNPDGSGQLYVPGLTQITVQSPEDINRGSRLREAQCINKSLSALGDVINALRSRHSHVPFRNSRLTYLLQDSLSGDSKTLMMVQVSPLVSNMSESVCSLKFAQRVRTIELGPASSFKRLENSSTSSSPTHDSVEDD